MNTEPDIASRPRTRITVFIDRDLIASLDEAAKRFPRDFLLREMLPAQITRLSTIPENSEAAFKFIKLTRAGERETRARLDISMYLSDAELLNSICKGKRIPADLFIEEVLKALLAIPGDGVRAFDLINQIFGDPWYDAEDTRPNYEALLHVPDSTFANLPPLPIVVRKPARYATEGRRQLLVNLSHAGSRINITRPSATETFLEYFRTVAEKLPKEFPTLRDMPINRGALISLQKGRYYHSTLVAGYFILTNNSTDEKTRIMMDAWKWLGQSESDLTIGWYEPMSTVASKISPKKQLPLPHDR